MGWVRDVIDDLAQLPAASGAYLNFGGDAEVDTTDLEAAFGQNVEPLAQLKRIYDPDNRFRLNANIPPAP